MLWWSTSNVLEKNFCFTSIGIVAQYQLTIKESARMEKLNSAKSNLKKTLNECLQRVFHSSFILVLLSLAGILFTCPYIYSEMSFRLTWIDCKLFFQRQHNQRTMNWHIFFIPSKWMNEFNLKIIYPFYSIKLSNYMCNMILTICINLCQA